MKDQMILGMYLGTGYGSQPTAWRADGVQADNYTNLDAVVRHAQAAERGKFAFVFLPDFPAFSEQMAVEQPQMTLDPIVTLTAIARETERIGLVATGSTIFNEPYNLARQFKALDVVSHGRAGWNAVTTSDPTAAANYGAAVAERPERYARAHEMIQIVEALWGSWGKDAWIKDKASGRFVDVSKVQPANLQGQYLASRGPLPIPPSEQGQPVIFSAGGGQYGLTIAGRHASGVIGAAYTIEDARAQREAARQAAQEAGRNPDDVKFFAGLMVGVGKDARDVLDRRLSYAADHLPTRLGYLGSMLGLQFAPEQIDQPLTEQQLAAARPSSFDPRSERALEVAREGWTLREVLAHGVIDYHPTPIGSPETIADHLQEWFEAGACDGFWLSPDVHDQDVDLFVEQVVPILQERGLYHRDYEGTTLRGHLGVPAQYGPDPRVA